MQFDILYIAKLKDTKIWDATKRRLNCESAGKRNGYNSEMETMLINHLIQLRSHRMIEVTTIKYVYSVISLLLWNLIGYLASFVILVDVFNFTVYLRYQLYNLTGADGVINKSWEVFSPWNLLFVEDWIYFVMVTTSLSNKRVLEHVDFDFENVDISTTENVTDNEMMNQKNVRMRK